MLHGLVPDCREPSKKLEFAPPQLNLSRQRMTLGSGLVR
jgi:hypothetical protein